MMEEVDSIILHFLRQLHINIDEDIKNICDLPVEKIVESASKCLSAISHSHKVPTKLPIGISHRIEVAAQIALICKDLGYKNDVGYQTFLYYNEAELRQVFMFLIECLPNENKLTGPSPGTEKSSLIKAIRYKIQEDLAAVWIPPCCTPSTKQVVGDYISSTSTDILNNADLNEEEIVSTLLKMKQFTQDGQKHHNYMQEQEIIGKSLDKVSAESASNFKYKSNKSLKELKENAVILRQKLENLKSESSAMDYEYTQVQRATEKIEADLKNVKYILHSIGITDTDHAADNILQKVQKNMNVLHRQSEELTSRSLSLRVEIDKVKNHITFSESERSQCKKALLTLKDSAKAMQDEYDKREVNRNHLRINFEKIKSGNKRSIYTKRILEIISNVDKQNMEIKKILDDTRQLQKEINTLEGQLDRCFCIADETLFKDAKKDDQAKKAYKLLALLHSECNSIVSLVNDTGTFARDKVDLEDNIKTEKAKKTEDTLAKILDDLRRMKEESNINSI